ncbi:winged helix-turn-helix domain-containing protein [Chitinophaga barathri]|uniref:DNA-binding response regulator n=1 Tax=Chitinophaga barathri TaxID=1647451 RepID=A0A3N4N0V7_9BACT|nr:winged helix-turn-helix domain-containing protein [Chitinophaga barathri]RPD41273.1 DNA-binding response regulator [Chitinophaga barathri]
METVKIVVIRDDVLAADTEKLSAQLSQEFSQVTTKCWKVAKSPDIKNNLHIIGPDLRHEKAIPVTKSIRNKNEAVPIIAVRTESSLPFKLSMFDAGVDDYLGTPYDAGELIRRIRVFLKWTKRLEADGSVIFKMADLLFDYNNLVAKFDCGSVSRLTQRQADLLRFFSEHPDVILDRGEILYHVWGKDDYFLGRSMDVIITSIRKVLSASLAVRLETIHGKGFILHTK